MTDPGHSGDLTGSGDDTAAILAQAEALDEASLLRAARARAAGLPVPEGDE